MGLKEALLANKKRLDDITNEAKLKKMLDEQKLLVASYAPPPVVKPKKLTLTDVLNGGGVGYTKTVVDGKVKNLRISLTSVDNDVVLAYHCRISTGERFSVSANSYKVAQQVVDEVFGKGMYSVSGAKV